MTTDLTLETASKIFDAMYTGEDYDGSIHQEIYEWLVTGMPYEGESIETLINDWREYLSETEEEEEIR